MGLQSRASEEWGQSLVVVTLMLVVLVGFLGLVVDVGNLYAQRRSAQNAADAGALAGARMAALNETLLKVQGAVYDYAVTHNGAHSVISDVQGSTVAVTVTKVVPTYFMGVMGIHSNTVYASAEAGNCPLDRPSGLMPFGAHKDKIKFAPVQSLIWDSANPAGEADYPPGWEIAKDNLITAPHRGWINLYGNGEPSASQLKYAIDEDGFDGVMELGIYDGSVGTMASLLGVLKAWIDPLPKDDPRRNVIVPVYDYYEQDGAVAKFHICGYATMHIIEVHKTTDFKYILGEFIPDVVSQEQARCGTADYGTRIVQLER